MNLGNRYILYYRSYAEEPKKEKKKVRFSDQEGKKQVKGRNILQLCFLFVVRFH